MTRNHVGIQLLVRLILHFLFLNVQILQELLRNEYNNFATFPLFTTHEIKIRTQAQKYVLEVEVHSNNIWYWASTSAHLVDSQIASRQDLITLPPREVLPADLLARGAISMDLHR